MAEDFKYNFLQTKKYCKCLNNFRLNIQFYIFRSLIVLSHIFPKNAFAWTGVVGVSFTTFIYAKFDITQRQVCVDKSMDCLVFYIFFFAVFIMEQLIMKTAFWLCNLKRNCFGTVNLSSLQILHTNKHK